MIRKILFACVLVFIALVAYQLQKNRCVSVWISHGLEVQQCPDGTVHPGASIVAHRLRRGTPGIIKLSAHALYTTNGAQGKLKRANVDVTAVEVRLIAGKQDFLLSPTDGWVIQDGRVKGSVTLPAEIPDGDHQLRATVTSKIGMASVETTLYIFAPARVHMIADRPLYEAGNTIKFRALALRAQDLAPLEGRPGKFSVRDPSGLVVLEDRAPTGPWGIAAGEFVLDQDAPTGRWTISWTSAGATSQTQVTVEPFTLPRFTIEAAPVKPSYQPGQTPRLRGTVTYASGAPVDASVEVQWSSNGAWPPPRSWFAKDLPRRVTTDKTGRFEIDFPKIPLDLKGNVTINASMTAIDPAADKASTQASILLSEDAIAVSAVTELDGRLLEGFNNRMYLRATTAAGRALAGVTLNISKAWDKRDPGEDVTTDVDGVAVVQIDPGPPVTVVIPPQPVRPPPPVIAVKRVGAFDLIRSTAPSLKDINVLDRWNRVLKPCVRFVEGAAKLTVSLSVSKSGALDAIVATGGLGQCVVKLLTNKRLSPGKRRFLRLQYRFKSELPTLSAETESLVSNFPELIFDDLEAALLDARACLDPTIGATHASQMLLWRTHAGRFTVRFEDDPAASPPFMKNAVERCIQNAVKQRVGTRKLEQRAERESSAGLGLVRFQTRPGPRSAVFRAPAPTTMLGYELKVTAKGDDELIGSTLLRLQPGQVPNVRLRATPVLVKAGGTVTVDLLRGPNFRGTLPLTLQLVHEQKTLEAKLDPKTRQALFKLPSKLDGWFHVSWQGAQARIYVRPKRDLQITLTPDQAVYKPGATAQLTLHTTAGGRPVAAAATLIGVDETLGQLAPLPGPDALNVLTPAVGMRRSAFGILEGTALAQGIIRGEHAAAATVLLVSSVPTRPELDIYVSGNQSTTFDEVGPLTDHFYTILDQLHRDVRRWEKEAPKGEVMRPATMRRFWREASTILLKTGADVSDAFGRRLTLKRLPDDLLLLVGPRAVVIDGKRLPEDVENWVQWVRGQQR